MDDKEKFAAVEQRTGEFYRIAMEFARRHPEINVVIKTKAAGFYAEQVNAIKEQFFKEQSLPNLVITNSADPARLIRESVAVLSYNSTTLIESLLAGKMIITPDYGDVLPNRQREYFGNFPELVHYVTAVEQLEELVLHTERYSQVDEHKKNEFLRGVMYLPDGQASRRAEQAILQTIAA